MFFKFYNIRYKKLVLLLTKNWKDAYLPACRYQQPIVRYPPYKDMLLFT